MPVNKIQRTNSETDVNYYKPDLFVLDSTNSIRNRTEYDSLDHCINDSCASDLCSVMSLVRGHSNRKKFKTEHLRPVLFIQLNTNSEESEITTIRALLDSGAAGTMISNKYAKTLRIERDPNGTTEWTTPGGTFATSQKAKCQFILPELNEKSSFEWNCYLLPRMGSNYEMILGRDFLEFAGIDILFSNQTIVWGEMSIPFKSIDATVADAFHVDEDSTLVDINERMKKILDAKYEAADLNEVVSQQTQLSNDEKQKLYQLLVKFTGLFDGTLGKYTGSPVELKLKRDAEPYHARAFPIPRVHLETLKLEVDRLCKIGVLKRVNRSRWAAPTFIIPKKDKTVRFISDFRELNKRIHRVPYPIPHIQDMLLNLEGFSYATSLDLNMGYYHLELSPQSKELCTIVLPFGKFEYQRIPMGLCNSPDIFQEKMNELFSTKTKTRNHPMAYAMCRSHRTVRFR